MDKLLVAKVLVNYGEGGAGHTAFKAKTSGHATDKGSLSGTQVAVHSDHCALGESGSQTAAQILGVLLAVTYILGHNFPLILTFINKNGIIFTKFYLLSFA
jgi:hypothetical protein